MNDALWQALLVASGGLLSFGPILIVLVMLSMDRGARKAGAYVAGQFLMYGLIGATALLISANVGGRDHEGPSWMSVTPMLVAGVLLLVVGLKRHFRPSPAANKPPKWLDAFERMSVTRSLGFGALVALFNLKNMVIFLSAIAVILEHQLPLPQGLAVLLGVDLVFCASVAAPVVLFLLFTRRALPPLARLRKWLEEHHHAVAVAVLLFFGAAFLIKGLIDLPALL